MWETIQRLLGRRRQAMFDSAGSSDRERLRQLIGVIASTHEHELDCHECFELMDRFAELSLSGEPVSKLMPLVQDHLGRCASCREEYEALVAAVEGVSESHLEL